MPRSSSSSNSSRRSSPSTRGTRRSRRSSPSSRGTNSRGSSRGRSSRDITPEEDRVFQFHEYVYGRNIQKVKEMLEKDPTLIRKNEENTQTRDLPITTAIQSVNNSYSENSETATSKALDMFKYLLKQPGLDLTAKTKLAGTNKKSNVLFFAINLKEPSVIKELIEKEPRLLNIKTEANQISIVAREVGKTPLQLVTQRYNINNDPQLREIKNILERSIRNLYSRRRPQSRRGGGRKTKKVK